MRSFIANFSPLFDRSLCSHLHRLHHHLLPLPSLPSRDSRQHELYVLVLLRVKSSWLTRLLPRPLRRRHRRDWFCCARINHYLDRRRSQELHRTSQLEQLARDGEGGLRSGRGRGTVKDICCVTRLQ